MFQPLSLESDLLVSKLAFKFNLYRYVEEDGSGVGFGFYLQQKALRQAAVGLPVYKLNAVAPYVA
jgi:hypothetical protein